MKALLDLRFTKPILYGLGFAFALFLSMQTLIATGRYMAEKGEKLQVVDFVRLKKESDLETRERRKPPHVLLKRGWLLMRQEPRIVAHAVALGCEPMTSDEAYARVTALVNGSPRAPHRRA